MADHDVPRVSDEGLARVVRGDFGDAIDPVVAAVADDVADRHGVDRDSLRRAGCALAGALGTSRPLSLTTAMAVLSARRRADPAVGPDDLHVLLEGDTVAEILVSALVRRPPTGGDRRTPAEAGAVEELLCMLIYMFRAESAARLLSARVS